MEVSQAKGQMIISAEGIREAAQRLGQSGKRKRIAVAAAQDADVLAAVTSAREDGICDATLFGDKARMEALAIENGIQLEQIDIVNQADVSLAVREAAELASSGGADVIMKGFVATSTLLKGVLDKRFNLRAGETLSHVAVLDIPGYHKLLMFTDGGMVVKPSPRQKVDICANAVRVGRALGINPVKVALSAADEDPDSSMPQVKAVNKTLALLREDPILSCEAAGPMPFDIATNKDAADFAGIKNSVAGDADVYLVDSIEEGNIVAKSLIVFAEAIFAGVIVGARLPVSVVSRTDPMIGKKTSLALACLISDFYQREGLR